MNQNESQAIITKTLGPTDTRGLRVKASCYGGNLTLPYNHAFSAFENHQAAAFALICKMGWAGEWVSGTLPTGGERCWCSLAGYRSEQ